MHTHILYMQHTAIPDSSRYTVHPVHKNTGKAGIYLFVNITHCYLATILKQLGGVYHI